MRCFIALVALASASAAKPTAAQVRMAATGKENTLTTLHKIGPSHYIGSATTLAYVYGSFVVFFQPNVGIAGLTGFWPARPESVEALQRDGVDLAHPDLMNQIPAYSHPRDATTGARPGNRVGSWRRSQLRLEADACVPKRPDQI